MKNRKHKFSFKNFILWTVFYFNFLVFLLSICCLDSDIYWLFCLTTLASLGYMVLFGLANFDKFEKWLEKKDKKIKKTA